MELHSQRKSSGVGKWLVGLALLILFFLTLASPRFWEFGSSDHSQNQSALARLGSVGESASPEKQQTPRPAAPIAVSQPETKELPQGDQQLASTQQPAQPVVELPLPAAQAKPVVPNTVPGPRIFGAGAVTDKGARNDADETPHVPAPLTFPQAVPQLPERPVDTAQLDTAQRTERVPSTQVQPIPTFTFPAETSQALAADEDEPSADNGSRTELKASPAKIDTTASDNAPLSREEIVVARWPWLRPRRMSDYLDQLAGHAQCEIWAEDTRYLIEGTYDPTDLADNLPALREQIELAEVLIADLGNTQEATAMRRAAYALKRQLVVWEGTVDSLLVSNKSEALTGADARELLNRIQHVEARLAGSSDRDAWRRYLRLDELAAFAEQATAVDQWAPEHIGSNLLRDIAGRFEVGALSAGQRAFLAADELASLHEQLIRMTTEPADRAALLTSLEQFEFSGLPSDAQQLTDQLHALRASGRAEDRQLANTIEGYYRNNNVRVVVSDAFLTRLLPPQVDRNEVTDDTILGVPIHGQSTTKTRLALRMAPGDSAALEMLVMGDVDSLTRGESGPVRTYNHTDATYVVHKKLVLDGNGIRALPGTIDVYADSQLQCLETDFDGIPLFGSIVRSVAEDKVHESRDEARREIEQRISAKVLSRVDSEADAGFAKMNGRLFQHITTAQKLGLAPAAWFQHPDDHRLAVHLRMAAENQLAANTPRPRALSNSVASVQVHQSMLNNVLESLDFNGRTLTVEEAFVHVMEKLTLGMSFASLDGENAEITFAEENPVTITLDEGLVRLSLRLEHVHAAEGDWGPLAVHVNYRPEPAGAGYALYREGPISLDSRSLRFRDRVLLRGVFSNVFKKDRPVSVLGYALRSDPRFAGLGVTQLDVEDGWIGLSIGPALDRLVETPADRDRSLNLRR